MTTCKKCSHIFDGLQLIDGMCHSCTNKALIEANFDAENYRSIILQILNQLPTGATVSFQIQNKLTTEAINARVKDWRAYMDRLRVEQLQRLDELRLDALQLSLRLDREIGSIGQTNDRNKIKDAEKGS
jgi:hypothetical protein